MQRPIEGSVYMKGGGGGLGAYKQDFRGLEIST